MAKPPPRKERIKPPTKKATTDASGELRRGHPAGGRVMADRAVAVLQRIVYSGKKKP